MHQRVESLPTPDPDYRRFLSVLRRQRPDRIPLIELAVHADVINELAAEPASVGPVSNRSDQVQRNVRVLHRLGYDVIKASAPIPFGVQRLAAADSSELSTGSREWQDQHAGAIGDMADCERFHWPTVDEVDFSPLDTARQVLPDGMRLIGFSGGVLEFAMDLIGMERFMYATYDCPELIGAVINRVGRTIHSVFEAYCRMDAVCALWLGDDLGSKNGLLVSPELLTTYVVPWYKRLADLAHEHDLPFMLHTCGKTDALMPTLVNEVGIDAKHSFEDSIQPVERFIDDWGDKLAVLGGVDVNLLSIGTEDAIRTRTREILEYAAPRGGYACGSGNSIPNYVSTDNYLALVETLHAFNGRL